MGLKEELQHYQEQMIDEYQRAQIIDQLGREITNTTQINDSLTDANAILGGVESDVARLAAVVDHALPTIVEQLALSADRLGGIEQMLASPTETAATELYRRGSFALSSGWVEEAVADLSRAVDTYPYHPKAWFNLGLALERQGSSEAAAEALLRCARYCVDQSKPLAATATLVSAGLYRLAGQFDKALDAIHKFLPDLERCAEIHLSLVVHHGELKHLSAALELMPMLAADARAAGVPSVETVAADVCGHSDGPVARLRQLEHSVEVLIDASDEVGLEGISGPSCITLPDAGVDALLLAEFSLTEAVADARRIGGEVKQELDRLTAAVRYFSTQVDACEREITQRAAASARNVAAEVALIQQQVTSARHHAARLYEPLAVTRRDMVNVTFDSKLAMLQADYEADLLPFHEWSENYYGKQRYLADRRAEAAAARQKASKLIRMAEQWSRKANDDQERLFQALAQPVAKPWLRAVQDAEAEHQKIVQARWEYAKAQDHIWVIEKMLTEYDHGDRGASKDPNWQAHRQRHLQRRVVILEEARANAEAAGESVDLALAEVDRAEKVVAQTTDEARRTAEYKAQRAYHRSERAAQESLECAQQAAHNATEAAQRSTSAMAIPLQELTTAISIACALRPRVAPFAHSFSAGTKHGSQL